MKVTIERSVLLRALGHVQSAVERRNTIPVLSNVLLDAKDGQLSLSATDMDLEIVETVTADVVRPGTITAPAHTLFDIVRKLPDGSQVELDYTDKDIVALRSGRSNFKLGSLSADDFPQMSGGDMSHHFTIGAAELKSLIDRTKFAISTEETRYYLNGIYMHAVAASGSNGAVLRTAATDGHRLARVETTLPDGAADMPGVIIPRKTILEVRKLADATSGTIQISLSQTKIRFSFGDVVITSKLIDGTFPDYERVIPASNDKDLQVDPKVFSSAVDRVATVVTEKSRAVKLSLDKGSLVLSATSAEAGSAMDELEVNYASSPLEIGFNSRYLLDITQQIEGERAIFSMFDAASPTIVRDAANNTALYVIMPMRV